MFSILNDVKSRNFKVCVSRPSWAHIPFGKSLSFLACIIQSTNGTFSFWRHETNDCEQDCSNYRNKIVQVSDESINQLKRPAEKIFTDTNEQHCRMIGTSIWNSFGIPWFIVEFSIIQMEWLIMSSRLNRMKKVSSDWHLTNICLHQSTTNETVPADGRGNFSR